MGNNSSSFDDTYTDGPSWERSKETFEYYATEDGTEYSYFYYNTDGELVTVDRPSTRDSTKNEPPVTGGATAEVNTYDTITTNTAMPPRELKDEDEATAMTDMARIGHWGRIRRIRVNSELEKAKTTAESSSENKDNREEGEEEAARQEQRAGLTSGTATDEEGYQGESEREHSSKTQYKAAVTEKNGGMESGVSSQASNSAPRRTNIPGGKLEPEGVVPFAHSRDSFEVVRSRHDKTNEQISPQNQVEREHHEGLKTGEAAPAIENQKRKDDKANEYSNAKDQPKLSNGSAEDKYLKDKEVPLGDQKSTHERNSTEIVLEAVESTAEEDALISPLQAIQDSKCSNALHNGKESREEVDHFDDVHRSEDECIRDENLEVRESKLGKKVLASRSLEPISETIEYDGTGAKAPPRLSTAQLESQPSIESSPTDIDPVEIDISFVEKFETMFRAFAKENPVLVERNPELFGELRVLKLQKMLEIAIETEALLSEQLVAAKQEKDSISKSYHDKLIEASRAKSNLQMSLAQTISTKRDDYLSSEATLKWNVISKTLACAQDERKLALSPSGQSSTRQLVLPNGKDYQLIKSALDKRFINDQDDPTIRRNKVEGALLKAEVRLMTRKLEYLRAASEGPASWVKDTLLQMNESETLELKNRLAPKANVIL